MNIAEAPSSQELNFLAETFRLLGDPSRLKILLHCEDGPKSVTDISELPPENRTVAKAMI